MVILLIMQQVLTNLQNKKKNSLGYIEHATKHEPPYYDNIYCELWNKKNALETLE